MKPSPHRDHRPLVDRGGGALLAPRDQTMVLIVTTLAGFVSTFMGSSINIALPMIESEFHVSAVTLGWIPLAYILAAGAVLMPVGRISDLYGRKRIFVWGLAVFTVVAFASAFSPSVLVLIVLRVVQGLGAALIFASFTAMIILAYPPETRGRALGLNVAGVYLGLTLGPVLGGIIIHNIGLARPLLRGRRPRRDQLGPRLPGNCAASTGGNPSGPASTSSAR